MPAIGIRPWTPKLIATEAWFDASDLSAVIDTTNPGKVEQWSDLSGKGNHVTETNVALKPSTGTRTLNGKNVIDFNDAVAERLLKTAPTGLRNTDYDIYAVAISDLSDNENLFTFRGGGTGFRPSVQGGIDGFFMNNDASQSSSNNGSFAWDSNPHVLSWNWDGDRIWQYRDGVNDPLYDGGFDVPDQPMTIQTINLCTNDFSAGRFDGAIAEFIITPHLSTEDRQSIEGYLAHKWGLTASLPEDHPFRYRPPADSSLHVPEDWDLTRIAPEAWYDAADESTITDAAGVVSQWDDKSGNARHLAQGTGALQPTTGVNTIGGLNAISADQDYMSAAIAAGTFPVSMQVTGVIKKTGANTTLEAFFGRTVTNKPSPVDRYSALAYVGNGSSFQQVTGMTNIQSLTSATLISTLANTTNVKEWIDGTNTKDAAHGATYDDTATTFVLGSRADGATTFRGDWGEIIVTPELSDSDRQKLEGYLAHKWGLQANLPANHPYKTEKPRMNRLWTPNEIATDAWYDANDPSTITDAGAGAVSAWNDKSGNANHLVQATPAQRPTIAGNNVTFGLDDNMDFTTPLGTSYYAFAVGAPRVNTALRTLLYTGAANQPFVVNNGSDAVGLYTSSFTGAAGITWAEAERALMGFVAAGQAYQKNGGTLAFVFSPSVDKQATALGGNAGNDSEGFGGVNEVLIVPVPLDQDTVYKIEGYLAWKWGFPHQLPDTHPYKRRPPMV